MNNPLLRDIFDFLAEHRPHYGLPGLIILGGSQTLDGGKHKTSSSDHDILIFFPAIDRAESFSFTSGDGLRKYDLILRDPKTFAYDLSYVSDAGRGTLLHIGMNGHAIYDPKNLHPALRDHIAPVYSRGPNLPHRADFMAEINALRRNLRQLRDIRLADGYIPALIALTNRLAKNFLLYNGHWTSTGKIAGRFLHEKMPATKGLLERSFNVVSRSGDVAPYETIVLDALTQTYFAQSAAGRAMAAPAAERDFSIDEQDFGNATTVCRLNLDAFAAYLQGNNPVARLAAITWMHSKIETVGRAIDTERFHRPSGEYFYALGRGISSLSEIYAAMTHPKPSDMSMIARIARLSEIPLRPRHGKSVSDSPSPQPAPPRSGSAMPVLN